MDQILIVVLVVVVALAFDFTNGFHDTANAMATSVATGALKPRVAVLISAVLNLVGAFLSTEVAKTISGGIIKEGDGIDVGPALIFAGLVGAVLWNLATWFFGLPSSSSHALFGGLIGASVIGAGFGAVDWGVLISKVVLPAVLSPIIAGFIAMVATFAVYRITRHARVAGATTGFRHGQTVSASLVSLAHGTNDAQKTMGVITLTFIAAGLLPADSSPPIWVILLCGLAIASGTYMGGWRIMRTVGTRITDVESPQGFAAEASSAATILASSHLGFALSTTQVTSGSVIGAGLGKRLASVRWGMVGRIATGWVLTLPAAALVGALAALVSTFLGAAGVVVVAVIALGGAVAFAVAARRNPVTPHNVNADTEGEDAPTLVPAGAGDEEAAR